MLIINGAIAWINFKKGYKIILETWIIEYLKMFNKSELFFNLHHQNYGKLDIRASGPTWWWWIVKLAADEQIYSEVKIQTDIYMGTHYRHCWLLYQKCHQSIYWENSKKNRNLQSHKKDKITHAYELNLNIYQKWKKNLKSLFKLLKSTDKI